MKADVAGRIHQLNVSAGGVPKYPVPAVEIRRGGVSGDRQSNRRAHGGPQRAVCLYALERIEGLLEEGHRVFPGALGENVTVKGIPWEMVMPGARLQLGEEVLIEITSFTVPCWKNACWFIDGRFNRIGQTAHRGWSRVYARVLSEGHVEAGDPIRLEGSTAAERLWRAQPPTFHWPPRAEL